MEIRQISDNISIYSDGQRLQVIHDLGDEFIIDVDVVKSTAYNMDKIVAEFVEEIVPAFKVSGFCSRGSKGLHRLKWAILQFGFFEEYIKDNQADLLDWWNNPGGEEE